MNDAPSILDKLANLREQDFRLTDRARLEWMLQGVRIAVQADDYESAYQRLRAFAESVEFGELEAWARSHIIFGLVEAGAVADAEDLTHDLQSLPAATDQAASEAQDLGLRLFELDRPLHAMMLAEALIERFPDDGYGYYLLARSYESSVRNPEWADRAFVRMKIAPAELYQVACALFEDSGRDDLARDARVSWVQIAYATGKPDSSCRTTARELREALTAEETIRLLAPSLARASMFTDRFRALDLYEDVGEGIRLGKPGISLGATEFRNSLRAGLEALPDDRREDEDERWTILIETWFDDAEAARRRQALDALLYEAVELSQSDPGSLANEIRALGFGQLSRPYIELWLQLEEIDQDSRAAWQPAIVAWIPRAESPSFGFGALAAAFHRWKLPLAADAASRRSRLDAELLDPETEAFLAVRNIAHALKNAPHRLLLEHLDRLHDVDQPNADGR